MGTIFIDTSELRDIARDLRGITGRMAGSSIDMGRGAWTTDIGPPASIFIARVTSEQGGIGLLGTRVTAHSAILDAEAVARDADEATGGLVANLTGLGTVFLAVGATVGGGIAGVGVGAVTGTTGVIGGVVGAVGDGATSVWNWLTNKANSVATWLKGAVDNTLDYLAGALSNAAHVISALALIAAKAVISVITPLPLRMLVGSEDPMPAWKLSGLMFPFFGSSRPVDIELTGREDGAWRAINGLILDDASPSEIQDYLASLDRATLINIARMYPEVIGSLDGAPVIARHEANMLLLERELEKTPFNTDRRASLGWILKSAMESNGKLLAFDPTGDGKAAFAFGDVTQAEDLAVFVPGVGNNLDNFANVMSDASTLHSAMDQHEPGRSHAVVAWLGYDTPGSVADGISPSYANLGAPSLDRFVDGLRAVSAAPHISAVGHSYGSVVVGHAASSGVLNVNDAVFIGSPGVGAPAADQLHLTPGGHVWAGLAWADPIALAPVHGPMPTDPGFGAQTFDTGGSIGHGQYFQHEALENMARIANGQMTYSTGGGW